jgi:tetratricopeptide (TPR) repeat protein
MLDKSAITKAAQKFAAKGQIDKAIAEWEKLLKESRDGNIYNTVGDLYLKQKGKREAVDAFMKAAYIFKEDGFYLKAMALYKKILNVAPLEVAAHTALGDLNAEKGLVVNASENFLAAAEIYIRDGATEKALELYEKILKITPFNINLKIKIAELYLKIGLKNEAVKEYLVVALNYLEKGEHGKAQEYYLRVIGFETDNVTALVGLSRTADETNDVKQAYEYLNKAMSIAPDNNDVMLNYAKLAIKTNNIEEAKQSLTKLVEINPSNNQYKNLLGSIYLKEGLTEKAWEEMLPCIDEALHTEKWNEALELLNKFEDFDPVAVKSRLITVHKRRGNKDAAINELKTLAGIYESKNMLQDVLQSYKELLKLNPTDETARNRIKEVEASLGVEAVSSAEALSEEKPIEEILSEADVYVRHGMFKDAVNMLEGLKKREPDNIEICVRLKNLYVQNDDKEKAVGECLLAAELYEKKGDLETKNNLIAEAVSLNPADPRLAVPGITTPRQEEFGAVPEENVEVLPEGEAVLSEEEIQESFEEKLAEADFYVQQGLKDEAIKLYEELLAASSGNDEIIRKLEALKPVEKAGKMSADEVHAGKPGEHTVDHDLRDIFHEFKKGIDKELGEEDFETRYNLGIAYREMGLLEDAIREFQIASKDPKKTIQSSSMLALCYMDKKLYHLAIEEFKKIVEPMAPTDYGYLEAKCDLADAYVKNKEQDVALKLYKEISAQNPNFKDVANKISILDKLGPDTKEKPKPKKGRVSYI